ncbi:MAG: hypothetical protein Q9216_003168 [Gyalolechia sp. 2 TL-2023]
MKIGPPVRQVSVRAETVEVPHNSHVSKTASAPMKAAQKLVKFMQQPLLYQDVDPENSSLPPKRPVIVAQSRLSVLKEPKVRTSASSLLKQEKWDHSQNDLTVEAGPSEIVLSPTSQPQAENREGGVAGNLEAQDIQVDDVDQNLWREYEIPPEVEILQPDMPEEIKNVVQESLDEQRAMRLSQLQMPPNIPRATSSTDHVQEPAEVPVVAESSAMASNKRSYSSSSKHCVESTDSSSHTDNRLGSRGTGQVTPKPQSLEEDHASRSSEERQHSDRKAAKGKLQKGREKFSKTNGLFRKLRRLQDVSLGDEGEQGIETHECVSCFDDIPSKEAVTVPCRHKYCRSCFSQLIATALQDEDNFPPKCCLQEIPRTVLRKHLEATKLAAFDTKALEYSVAVGSRYYCARPECAKWIDTTKARSQNGTLECPHCRHSMCNFCRGPAHATDEDCPQDFGLDATLQQAERAGWQRCYSCKAMVELNSGCRHITCRCKAQFCYTCGARWRTCTCTEQDQARRAQQIRENLAKVESETRVEEEEIRAAIAAVEELENQAAEERREQEWREEEERTEEARQIALHEFERVEKINQEFDRLRGILNHVHSQQSSILTQRHTKQMREVETKKSELEATIAASMDVESERARIVSQTESEMQDLRKKHATEFMQARFRHRKDEDECLLAFSVEKHPAPDPATVLETLLSAQGLERSTLHDVQAREVEECKSWGEMQLRLFEERVKRQGEEWERVYEQWRGVLAEEVKVLKRRQWADWKWMELMEGERRRMLEEDERRVILSGGEVMGK